jgi:antitoxin (DNA-binding transcriptional repressor) of toxin-antitoxin stability system
MTVAISVPAGSRAIRCEPMADVSIRDLHRKNRQVIDRVIAGEVLTITRGGRPVARPSPLPRPELRMEDILERWKGLQPMAPDALRWDIDQLIDPSL